MTTNILMCPIVIVSLPVFLYNLFPQPFLLKDRVKTRDRRAYVTNSHQRATVKKKKLILFWHARSRRYRIPRRQSQNPASAPQLSHASPENLDPRNSQWPLLERVPCGLEKANNRAENRRKRMHVEGRVPASPAARKNLEKLRKAVTRSSDSCAPSFGRLIQTGAGCFPRGVTHNQTKEMIPHFESIFFERNRRRVKSRNHSRLICRNDNGQWNLQLKKKFNIIIKDCTISICIIT